MTPLDKLLARLRKLEGKATKGPWEADYAVWPYPGKREGNKSRAIYHQPQPHHIVEVVETPDELDGECIPNGADWKLIAESRNALPVLLEIISRQKQVLDYYADINGGPYAPGDYHTADGGERAIKAIAECDALAEKLEKTK